MNTSALNPARWSNLTVALVSIVGSLIAAVAVAVAVVHGGLYGVYTPTVNVVVINDTSTTTTLSGCASDIVDLDPGDKATLDVVGNDPRDSCFVYSGFDPNGRSPKPPTACLEVGKVSPSDNVTLRVSSAVPYRDDLHCGH